MPEVQHTPFPWEKYSDIVYSPGNGIVCQVSKIHPEGGWIRHEAPPLTSPEWDEAQANLDLIMTIPDMIAENTRLRAVLASHGIAVEP